jgi:uncharacterized protein YaiI (UPF0178 family)|tara:strand:+ start:455 stop:697 length:243 start_codon:yes stop_codon:yes gene_type:complete
LASEVLNKGALVLYPRGERYTTDNISQCLSMRDIMDELRSNDVDTGGPAAFSQVDRRAFAGALDRILQKVVREGIRQSIC